MEKRGLAISDGIACGKVLIYEPYKPPEGAVYEADRLESVQERLDAYSRALESAHLELENIFNAVAECVPEKAKIFQAHQLLLEDAAIHQDIQERIINGNPVSQAIADVFALFIDMLGQAENAFTNERTADLKDVRNRILRCLERKPERNLSLLLEPRVIFARELVPSDTATIDRKNVLAIVTELGGAASHTAIVAKSYGIPTVLGVEGFLPCAADGDDVIVDGAAGLVILHPDARQMDDYRQKQVAAEKCRQAARIYRDIPAVTQDGTAIAIELNISSAEGLCAEDIAISDGVGLMRSEFLYMQSKDGPPDEETQFREYKAAVCAFQGKPVILRTLDIGGDKQLPYMALPKEDNPFLGKRALRLCLEEPAIFRTQLRAALRASHFGELWLMFPMVSTLEDFRAAKAFTQVVMAELDREKIPYNKNIPLGIMIEVPSIALIADQAAREVDFASIGTNDLCQYLMAADRLNPSVAAYYQSYHPAVFRLIGHVAEQFSRNGKPLSVCGEMGGSPAAAIALVGLGLRMLSMGATDMAAIKRAITSITTQEAQRIAAAVCVSEKADEAKRILTEAAETIARRPAARQDVTKASAKNKTEVR
ncbi:MAG TPA: phosphoenolpyruvate--protein phosphotransferase [Pseudoflavonifractor sp.]|nr:phosphoenolpyruvate--protein phosphotransferase [Pseudoflavonifractor sp.]